MRLKHILLVGGLLGLFLTCGLLFLGRQDAKAQTCEGVAGNVAIRADQRNADVNHFFAEFNPASAYQTLFTTTLTDGVVLTSPLEFLGCFTTEDLCYGAFQIPTNTISFVTGVQTVTTPLERLRVEGCSIKIVPTRVSWDNLRPDPGSVTLLQNKPGLSGPLVQINAHDDGSWNAFALNEGNAVNVTDMLQANSRVISDSRGVFLEIGFIDFHPPYWTSTLTSTGGILVQIDQLFYEVGQIGEIQLQKGQNYDLTRTQHYGRSRSMLWPLKAFDPNACPKFVVDRIDGLTVFGRITIGSNRPDIFQLSIFMQDGSSFDVQPGAFTHTFAYAGTFAPITYGYNQGHEKVCEEASEPITVSPQTPTPTPTPTPKPVMTAYVSASSTKEFHLKFEGGLPPKFIVVTTKTRVVLVQLIGDSLALPEDWVSFDPETQGIVIQTGYAYTNGRIVFRSDVLFMPSLSR